MKAAMIVPAPQGGRLEIQDVPRPEPGPGQVLVRVMASGLNRGEIKLVREFAGDKPVPAGVEFAGVVAAVGPGVDIVREGDHVAGHGKGGQAQYALAAARALIKVPRTMPWTQVAAFPNVFITAHDALVTNGGLRKGETVLVNAATGGVGLAAAQLASLLGASQVFATTRSADKAARLREFGVTRAIDVSNESAPQVISDYTEGRGVDIIIDSVGGPVFEDNVKSLAVRGRLVNIARMGGASAELDITALWLKRLHLVGATFRTRTEEERLACIEACARDVLPLLEAGRIQLPVDCVFPLEQIAQAHAYMEADQHFGKIVLAVDPAAGAAL